MCHKISMKHSKNYGALLVDAIVDIYHNQIEDIMRMTK